MLIDQDPLRLSGDLTTARLLQRYTLLVLWFYTNGTTWANNTKWLVDPNECDWHGVTCSSSTSEDGVRHVEEIDLTSNNLRGLVPADLALLSTLHHLDMDEGDNVWTHDGLGLFGFLQPPGEWNDTH